MKAEAVTMTCKAARELLDRGVHALVLWRPDHNLTLYNPDNDRALVTIFDQPKGE